MMKTSVHDWKTMQKRKMEDDRKWEKKEKASAYGTPKAWEIMKT